MVLCSELGLEPRRRCATKRIRRRQGCCCEKQPQVAHEEPQHSHSYSQSHSQTHNQNQNQSHSQSQSLSLARITAAALTAAAMLHTTSALATGSLGSSASATAALPLHGTATPTATPATHELNASLLSSTTAAGLLSNDSLDAGGIGQDSGQDWLDEIFWALKAFVMLFIIIAAICGNLLVIISVMRVRKLRCVYVIFKLIPFNLPTLRIRNVALAQHFLIISEKAISAL